MPSRPSLEAVRGVDERSRQSQVPRCVHTSMAQIIDLEAVRRRRDETKVARRVSLRAHERGVGDAFDLALRRLVDRWDEPENALETLARAAEVSGLKLDDVLDAAYDPRRDDELAPSPRRFRRAR